MEKKRFPELIADPGCPFRLFAFQLKDTAALWSYIETDRRHPKRRTGWPAITDVRSLKDYVRSCDVCNPESEEFAYLIVDQKSEIVGTIHLHSINWERHWIEVGYGVHHRWEGQGVISTVLPVIERVVQEQGFETLLITCPEWNERSWKVAERNFYFWMKSEHPGVECVGCENCLRVYAKDIQRTNQNNSQSVSNFESSSSVF